MIIPGVLENSYEEIERKIKLLENDAKIIQVDLADGKLVKGTSLTDTSLLYKISSKAKLELHLMVKDPLDFVKNELPFFKISSEIEANDVNTFIQASKAIGLQVGLSLAPALPLEMLDDYIQELDFVQLMGVTPGAQGRPFDDGVINKIADFKLKYPNTPLQIDGSINRENITKMKELKVDHVVAGSAIYNTIDPVASFKELERLFTS